MMNEVSWPAKNAFRKSACSLKWLKWRVRRGVVIHEVHETLVGSQLKSVHVEACITKFLAVATGAEVVLLNPLQGANDRTTEVLPNDPQVEVARPLHLRVKFRQGLAKKLVTKLNLPLAHLPRSHRIIARCGPQSLFLTKLLLKLLNLRAQKLNPPCAKLIHDVRRDKEVEVETEATEDASHQGSLTYKKSMFPTEVGTIRCEVRKPAMHKTNTKAKLPRTQPEVQPQADKSMAASKVGHEVVPKRAAAAAAALNSLQRRL